MKKALSLILALCLLFCVSIPALSAQETLVRAASAETTLPAAFDLRTYGAVTPVKNQANTGASAAFSTIACMESSIAWQGYGKAADLDYSEAHLAWFSQRQRAADETDPTYGDGYDAANPFDDGSNMFFSTATLMRGSGVRLERDAPWTDPQSPQDAMRDMAQPEQDRYACSGRLYTAHWIYDYSTEGVKQALMQNGNVSMEYYHVEGGFNASHACYYQNQTYYSTNYAVEVVGWNDSFPKENFNAGMRPRANGAWLVKGSRGTGYGENGYYWLSYSDTSIGSIWTLTAKPKSVYDNIYQYDGTIPLTTISSPTSVRAANRFRSTKKETLTHIAFWSENYWGVEANIRIYVADANYVPSSTSPTSKMTLVRAATTSVKGVEAGYYTVELQTPVDVSNRYFTVELAFYPDSSFYRYAVMSLEGKGETAIRLDADLSYGGAAGQSFLYEDKWIDCTEYGAYCNVPIKAMTRESSAPSGFTLTYDAGIGAGAPDKQTGFTQYYIPLQEPVFEPQGDVGYTFLGWRTNASTTLYRPGDPITLTADTTLEAVWQKIEKPVVVDPKEPTVGIVNYQKSRTERYFTTMEFTAVATDMPQGAQLVWLVNDSEAQVGGETFVYYGAKKDYSVRVCVKQGNAVLAASESEFVDIRFGFADLFTVLFRLLLGRPYYVKQ